MLFWFLLIVGFLFFVHKFGWKGVAALIVLFLGIGWLATHHLAHAL